MNRQTFAKKPQRMFHTSIRQQTLFCRTSSTNHNADIGKSAFFQISNLNTPQKQEIMKHPAGQLQRNDHSSLSQFNRQIAQGRSLYQNHSNNCSRDALTQNISNFIDSHSSSKSDLSFRSDRMQLQRKDSSEGTQKITKTTFKYQSSLTTHQIKVFQRQDQFKPIFVKTVCEWIDEIFAKHCGGDKQKQNQRFEKFFASLKNLSINHPFKQHDQLDFKGFQTLESTMDKWLFQYGKFQKMILSFDFLFSHITYIVLMIFYWLQLQHNTNNPLISNQQIIFIQRNKQNCRKNILLSLRNYISQRSRQMINNPIIQKLLLQFDQYLHINYFSKRKSCTPEQNQYSSYIEDLYIKCQKESALKETLNLGKNFNDEHLKQIYQKYENKDKFIEENLQQQVTLFCETDKRNFVCTPLNRYYQTGSQVNTDKILAQKHNYLACWLLRLVLKRYKCNISIGVKYCTRFYQLSKLLFRCRNIQSCVFFMSLLYNIKNNLPNLWNKFLENQIKLKQQNVNEVINWMRNDIQKILLMNPKNDSKDIIIYQQTWIYKIITQIKQRFREKDLVSLPFHQDIQQFAKRIMGYRKALQVQLLKNQQIQQNHHNKTIKFNLNYRFLNYFIYEILKKEQISQIQMFEQWKINARNYDSFLLNKLP